MTVVAWDGAVLAADRMMPMGSVVYSVCKIRVVSSGIVLAATGDAVTCNLLMEWYEAGADRDQYPRPAKPDMEADLIVAKPDGTLWHSCGGPTFDEIKQNFAAFGMGAGVAVGAMAAGANAVRAVQIASEHASGCGGGYDAQTVCTGKVRDERRAERLALCDVDGFPKRTWRP